MNSAFYKQLFFFALFGFGTLILAAFLVAAQRSSFLTSSLLVFVFAVQRAYHFSNTTTPLHTLGIPNVITLTRGWLLAVCAGCLFLSSHQDVNAFAAATTYSLAALLDALDGWVARRYDSVTALGSKLDTSMDALGLLIAPLVAITLGKLHWSYAAVSAAYYLYIAGLQWRKAHNLVLLPLHPSKARRVLAGIQMAVVAIALWPFIPLEWSQRLGIIAMLPFLAHFLYDWLTVSNRLTSRI